MDYNIKQNPKQPITTNLEDNYDTINNNGAIGFRQTFLDAERDGYLIFLEKSMYCC